MLIHDFHTWAARKPTVAAQFIDLEYDKLV